MNLHEELRIAKLRFELANSALESACLDIIDLLVNTEGDDQTLGEPKK